MNSDIPAMVLPERQRVGTFRLLGVDLTVYVTPPDASPAGLVRRYLDRFARDVDPDDQLPPDRPGSSGRAAVSYEIRTPGAGENLELLRTRYQLIRDGALIYLSDTPGGLIDGLEWNLNGRVAARHTGYLTLHAGVVARGGRALIVPAASGSGKTSLTCALLRAGCAYLSDEAAVIDPATLLAHPYSKPLGIKDREWLAEQIGPLPSGPECWDLSTAGTWRIHPGRFAACQEEPVPVGWIVVPDGRSDVAPSPRPLARADALRALLNNCFNPDLHGARAIAVLSELVKTAQCYTMALGPPAETARTLMRLLDG